MSDAIPADAHVLIIGAMKCGTTSLFDYLKKHPAICPACDKEPEFFSEHQKHGVEVVDYNDLWSFDASRHRYALEASTGYTKYPMETRVPQRIAAYGLNPKFIYLVRNPFDRIESQYDFSRVKKPAVAIDDPYHVELSDYYLQLQQYQPYFARERFLILDFDEMVQAPVKTLDRVYEFLDIERHYPLQFRASNVTRRQPKSLASRLMKRLRSAMGHAESRGAVQKVSGERYVVNEKRLLTNDERRSVHRRLEDDMARLYHEYGFDVTKWGFAP